MLSSRQLEQYQSDGYALQPNFLSKAQVASLLNEVETLCAGHTLAEHDKNRLEMEPNQPPHGTKARRIYEPCTYYPRFRALSDSADLLGCVEQLMGPDLIFQYSKINMKPPAIGSVVEWHQDLAYYPLTNRDSVAVLCYLDDADVRNGCLQVIPSRHMGRLLDHVRDGFFQGSVTESVDESQAVPLKGKAGTAIFMHCMAPHCSINNTSNRPRRTLILSYRAADAFPIYFGEMTVPSEAHVRQVRGKPASLARFSMTQFPIPKYPKTVASLYELQELSSARS